MAMIIITWSRPLVQMYISFPTSPGDDHYFYLLFTNTLTFYGHFHFLQPRSFLSPLLLSPAFKLFLTILIIEVIIVMKGAGWKRAGDELSRRKIKGRLHLVSFSMKDYESRKAKTPQPRVIFSSVHISRFKMYLVLDTWCIIFSGTSHPPINQTSQPPNPSNQQTL